MAYTIGNFELSLFTDGTYLLDGGAMFGVIPKVMWEKKARADELNRIVLACNSLLIRDGKHTVLVETGIGPKLPEKRRNIFQNQPQLPDNLRAGGVDPAEIDIVINTHLHFDHCGWNTYVENGQVKPTFPNARYYTQAGEVEHGHQQHERDRVSYIGENYDPLIAGGQMQLLRGDGEITPGISVRVYSGHTRHMMAVLVRSGGKTACYISDLVPMLSHLDLTWVMGYDLFPLETIDNRKKFYEEAIRENWLVVFTHEPQTPAAFLDRDEKGKITASPV
ncbi:MAG TPA: MBL fold metallo-hydrolase [Terriglobales bacterium]|nr:MBL fold metallo-hydrolase [Terriglobales bacterium]HET7870926.1 MBL fold metallo-hydrolase [Terriglobales bacterium]